MVTTGSKMSIHFIGSTQKAPAFLVQVDNDYNVTTLSGETIKPYVSTGRAKLFAYLTGTYSKSLTILSFFKVIFLRKLFFAEIDF